MGVAGYQVLRQSEQEPRRESWQRGFSLVEVLIAIVLLAVGLLSLSTMQTYAVSSNSFGNRLTEATFLAQDKLEELHLLNELYLEVLAKPQSSWTAEDQAVVNNYTSQLTDTQGNWIDTDGDGVNDDFDWQMAPDHENADGGAEDPIDVSGATVTAGGYTRTWNVVDNVPINETKTVHVRVTWGENRQVNLDSVLSQ